MEISSNNGPSNIEAYVNQVHEQKKIDAPKEQEEAKKQAAKSDTVEISQAAKNVQEMKTRLEEVPDVRQDKVNELRNQIQNGTYKPDAEKTAHNMLKEALMNDLT